MREVINSKYGELKPNTYRSYWSGEWQLDAQPVTVITEFEDTVPEKVPERFEQFFAALPSYDSQFRRAAAENLLSLYNGTWSEGETISAEEFARRLEINGVSFNEESETVEVHYDDGDLFAGHHIKVDATYDGTVKSAALP